MIIKKIMLAVMVGVLPLMILIQGASASAVGPGNNFSFTLDALYGHVTVENDTLKVVWHDRITSAEFNNRGGGSIYELYDKRTDPMMQHNLVALNNTGENETTPNMPGIGGLGATHIWELGRSVSASDNARFSRLIGETHYIDNDGNAVFQASFIVKSSLQQYLANESTRPDNYRVDKTWTVFPNGQIKLDITMGILRNIMAAEPAYDFSFSHDYGWTTAGSLGHKWDWRCGGDHSDGVNNTNNYQTTIANINSTPDYDNQLLHSEFFSLYGRSGGSAVRVKMDNGGKGFENGGLFDLGNRIWGNTNNPTIEYSNYSQQAYGHTLRYFAWWGGSPPPDSRHKLLTAGTTWSDSVWIEVYPDASSPAPQVLKDATVEQVNPGVAAIKWGTNLAADTKVSYQQQGNFAVTQKNDARWTPEHHVALTGLIPGATYQYEARSGDGSGETVRTGSFTANGIPGVHLQLAHGMSNWASFANFTSRLLTVDFNVTNVGTEAAVAPQVLRVTADHASAMMGLNVPMGQIAPGQSDTIQIVYEVPAGITAFNTNIFLKASDANGVEHFFPSDPPAL
ncbi:MAG: hypothetical protein ACYCXF_01345 [Thermoleophilia bacterium]